MTVLPANKSKRSDLPLKLIISFEAIFNYMEKIAADKNHFLHSTSLHLLEEYREHTILRDGFEDFNNLNTYQKEISKLLDILFPELLLSNEIKAATIPFEFTMFKLSNRFKQIIEDAGEDYEFTMRNYDEDKLYIMSCVFILAFCYDVHIDFKRPFYYDIPNKKTGFMRHYRSMYNGDFFKIKALDNAPIITDEDVEELLDNFDNFKLWKEKFPIDSYEFKGFGLVNLFDVTPDELISNLKEDLIKQDNNSLESIEESISSLFGVKSIKFHFSTFDLNKDRLTNDHYNMENSVLMPQRQDKNFDCEKYFCEGVITKVFKEKKLLAISNIEKYGVATNFNGFYKTLKSKGIQSIILVPLRLNNDIYGVMELTSKIKYELNSINAYKLKDVIPVFKVAAQRYLEEFDNRLESIIQENYTSLHPTVKWKFYEAAREHIAKLESDDTASTNLKSIVFKDVIPLYGQSDIKGSSVFRNSAIQKDLAKQLNLAAKIIEKAKKIFDLPIYNDLIFRINEYKETIENKLDSGDEVAVTYFLKKDIYPVFNHLKTLNKELEKTIEDYMLQIDDQIHVIYEERKKYEESVNQLNEKLANFIDSKQIEAQKMFPHYFERFKTDGVEHNMYIGQSLVENRTYNEMFLYNLRLWQLEMICEMENIAYQLKSELAYPLEVASLILVHGTPMAIKFRMDEKHFDVDGAYNIRYEIIKKRIDKIKIKNTDQRLTQPGKISIVYNQIDEAEEYVKYIKHLQSKSVLMSEIEYLQLEDLQGTTGLKALRVSVNFNQSEEKATLDSFKKVLNK